MANTDKSKVRGRRKLSIRSRISGSAQRPRLSVFRSSKHIYAQVVDDDASVSLCAVSTLSKGVKAEAGKVESAKAVGTAIAEACKAKGISSVVFDRNGYVYHGRIKALAEAAREGGLQF